MVKKMIWIKLVFWKVVRSISMPLPETNSVNQASSENITARGIPHSDSNSGEIKSTAIAKIENIKLWSISTYKCTKQFISEKLGKTTRTVDTELESQIELLRDVQRKYLHILRLSRALSSHFTHVIVTQQGLGEAFADLAQKSPELQSEFLVNAETQRSLSRHGEVLMAALNFFVSSVNTLVNKTIEDTLITVKRYEAARIEYDAYRSDLEMLLQSPSSGQSSALAEAQRAYDEHKIEFEKLRADVSVKLRFLNENRVKVMHKQLLLFHNAVSAYFSGNETALQATLKQFNIKMKTGNAVQPSWLEQ
uniref:EOG090X0AQE n=1 Tax=Eubosmina coregoni TaxID=186181 RepID=A0A4Y7LPZ6_9CRUS|nr:EOG090X0AQE [Eubosmina coregoni]SVE69972.1 EOG090X0AQE [Eubosmina coregoni]